MAINPDELRKAYEKGVDAVAALVEQEVKRQSEKPKNHPPSSHQKPMFTELNTSTPSIRRVHNMIKDKEEVEVKLVTGDSIKGTVKWIDTDCICVDGAMISKNKDVVEISLVAGDTIEGTAKWIDTELTTSLGQRHTLVIWQHSIAFIATRSS